jgi:uncharacterized protein
MARPVKWRKIGNMPTVLRFTPVDATSASGENQLKLEELEAVRLKDLEGLEQADCAIQMGVSRPTFQRILLSARIKIADSLVNGKPIQIEGGHYTRSICPIRCLNCGREWQESLETIENDETAAANCPRCNSDRLLCCPDDHGDEGDYCRQRCRGRRRSGGRQ